MDGHDGTPSATFSLTYLALSGATTAACCPVLLWELVNLGFSSVIALPTPSASRVIAPRDLADVEGVRVVESYFDAAIRPRPPRGVTLFAPCSFNWPRPNSRATSRQIDSGPIFEWIEG